MQMCQNMDIMEIIKRSEVFLNVTQCMLSVNIYCSCIEIAHNYNMFISWRQIYSLTLHTAGILGASDNGLSYMML